MAYASFDETTTRLRPLTGLNGPRCATRINSRTCSPRPSQLRKLPATLLAALPPLPVAPRTRIPRAIQLPTITRDDSPQVPLAFLRMS